MHILKYQPKSPLKCPQIAIKQHIVCGGGGALRLPIASLQLLPLRFHACNAKTARILSTSRLATLPLVLLTAIFQSVRDGLQQHV